MDVALLLTMCFCNLACFLAGAKAGQTVIKSEPMKTPSVSPIKAYREHKQQKEAEAEKSKIDTILRNIDSYDGTGYGQEDV